MKLKLIFFLFFTSLLYADMTPLFFQGNQTINERELYESLSLEKPYFYEFWKDAPAIEAKTITLLVQTIKNYYKTKGFFNASVTYTQNAKAIYIEIHEDVPIRIADLTTISKLNVKSKIPFKVGDIFDATQFTQSKKDIKLIYANDSYCNAELDAKAWIDIEKNNAYLTYEVIANNPCHIGHVKINSPQSIDSEIIQSLLYFKENEPFSTKNVASSYVNLYGYEGISKVIINTTIENNNSVAITVNISENEKPIRFEGGLGFSSEEGAMVSVGLKHRNIFGNLKTASLETRLTQIKQTVKTNFNMPLDYGSSTGVEFGFENEDFIGFKESRVFASIYLMQRILPHNFKESLVIDNSKTYESSDNILFPEGTLLIVSPKLEWGYDTRDKILDPKKGYFLHSEIMGSLLSQISDATYYKLKLTGGYILPVQNSTLAMRVNFGTLSLIDGDIPASYHFYAGGMNSNRAYSYNTLGPTNAAGDPVGFNSIFETTLEYRFPIYGPFRGVVFNDNTFIGDNDVPNGNGYYSAGLGLRYVTPIGPLAIDIGFDILHPSTNYALHFRIGELF